MRIGLEIGMGTRMRTELTLGDDDDVRLSVSRIAKTMMNCYIYNDDESVVEVETEVVDAGREVAVDGRGTSWEDGASMAEPESLTLV